MQIYNSDAAEKAQDNSPLKPKVDKVNLENIPVEMKGMENWCLWRYELRHGKWTKVPKQPYLKNARSNDSSTWSKYDLIESRYSLLSQVGTVDGIGFFLSDDLVAVDLDHGIEKFADVVSTINSYSELSPSKNGIRIFARGQLPEKDRKNGDYEMFDKSSPKYMTVTGHKLKGVPATVKHRQAEVDEIHLKYIHREKPAKATIPSQSLTPLNEVPSTSIELKKGVTLEDVKWLVLQSPESNRLWNGDLSDYDNNHSCGDQALCNRLAMYVPDDETIDVLFRQSALYRDKWEREDYRERTIEKAIDSVHEPFDWSEFIPDRWIDEIVGTWKVPVTEDVITVKKEENHVRMVGIEELVKNANNQKEDWLLPDWLEYGSTAMLTGFPFSGKSCIVAELIAGMQKHGTFGGYDVVSSPIILVDLENRDGTIVRRLRTATEEPILDCLMGRFAKREIPETSLPLDVEKIEKYINACMVNFDRSLFSKFKPLVIIDTFRSAFSCDELETAAVKELLYPLQRVAQRTDAAILILHHRPKNGAHYSGGTAIAGALDYLWVWNSDIETRQGKLSLEGSRGNPCDPIYFSLNEKNRNVLVGMPQIEQQDEMERLITEAVETGGLNKQEIVLHVQNAWSGQPPGRHKIRNCIDSLEGSTISTSNGDRGAKIYSLL